MLAHTHVPLCPCSRCRVAREYARLLATVTDRPEADAPEPVAAEAGGVVAEPERVHLDVMRHA